MFFAVRAGKRHFPWLNNALSSSVYCRNVRRYIPHGYCDDYASLSRSYSTVLGYTELVFLFILSWQDFAAYTL